MHTPFHPGGFNKSGQWENQVVGQDTNPDPVDPVDDDWTWHDILYPHMSPSANWDGSANPNLESPIQGSFSKRPTWMAALLLILIFSKL